VNGHGRGLLLAPSVQLTAPAFLHCRIFGRKTGFHFPENALEGPVRSGTSAKWEQFVPRRIINQGILK
jgi:hypothetical protein